MSAGDMSGPVQTVPRSTIDDLVPGGLPPEDLDPLKDGILMAHQAAWVADHSELKIAEKGRRTGFTFAEATDSTLIAAAKKSAGGDHTWYIGDTKEKGLEFVMVCARLARSMAKELLSIQEFVFFDTLPDGSSRDINAYRIRFASGFQIAALSSRPAAIRGLQGRVVIDEAAFHENVRAVIDACNALLIWGGVIRIISTHNGSLNPFNELLKETREGKTDYKIHRATFDDAVANGLYERVCLIRGWTFSAEGKDNWYRRIRRSYGSRREAMREELDAVPSEGEGALLPLVWIENCSRAAYHVKRWEPPATSTSGDFNDWPEATRRSEMQGWLEREVKPLIEAFPPNVTTALGEDFAMRQDRTAFAIGYTAQDLTRHVPLIVEFLRCPYDQQKQALFAIVTWLRRFSAAILDANGNGMVLAQEARMKFGDRIIELMANDAWYREYTPKFRAAFEDRMIWIPADRDTRDDLRQFRVINGVGKIPRDVRTTGTDGGRRHADSAVALLNFYAATLADVVEIDYRATGNRRLGYGGAAAGLWGDARDGERSGGSSAATPGWGSVGGGTDMRGF